MIAAKPLQQRVAHSCKTSRRGRVPLWPSRTRCAASQDSFEAWLESNRLPGHHSLPAATATAAPSRALDHQQQLQPEGHTHRFHWREAPAVAAQCLKRYGHLAWCFRSPDLLIASGADGQPAASLALPRILSGARPQLFPGSSMQQNLQKAWPCPLNPRPEQDSLQLLQALHQLAASLEPSAGSGAAAGEGQQQQQQQQQQQAMQQQALCVGSQLVVLLSADSAALGLFREGELARHRVLTGYTVRRQQGKAQATYERQGGGAYSVGGSIRTRETRRLFQDAAATLAQWAPDIAGCNQLLRTGTVRVWNQLYASNDPPPPVDRRDPRWQAVGLGVRRPRLADVQRVFAALSHGSLAEGLMP